MTQTTTQQRVVLEPASQAFVRFVHQSMYYPATDAGMDEQLAGLPPAYVCVDEADVLRDEGEAYAARMREAGVAVIVQAISVLREALHSA
jgi:acetyl esterase/lipase